MKKIKVLGQEQSLDVASMEVLDVDRAIDATIDIERKKYWGSYRKLQNGRHMHAATDATSSIS